MSASNIIQTFGICEAFYKALLERMSGQDSICLFYFNKPPAKPSGPNCQETFNWTVDSEYKSTVWWQLVLNC